MTALEIIIVGYFILVAGIILTLLFIVATDMLTDLFIELDKRKRQREAKRHEGKRGKTL